MSASARSPTSLSGQEQWGCKQKENRSTPRRLRGLLMPGKAQPRQFPTWKYQVLDSQLASPRYSYSTCPPAYKYPPGVNSEEMRTSSNQLVRIEIAVLSKCGLSMQFTEQFDVVVVGAGHAGCEVEALARCLSRAPKSRAERGT